ncbi:12295_t:CDS:2 [Acaulospora colombiana]|uniref:12295_t:CDS:1 n=1 Tax=Acaulospora colombiana TaxID=27376 RepID=A0ACA9NCQ5_9GLOM|nr:12295_t:CDS:2 [Acaulospora colombiana]
MTLGIQADWEENNLISRTGAGALRSSTHKDPPSSYHSYQENTANDATDDGTDWSWGGLLRNGRRRRRGQEDAPGCTENRFTYVTESRLKIVVSAASLDDFLNVALCAPDADGAGVEGVEEFDGGVETEDDDIGRLKVGGCDEELYQPRRREEAGTITGTTTRGLAGKSPTMALDFLTRSSTKNFFYVFQCQDLHTTIYFSIRMDRNCDEKGPSCRMAVATSAAFKLIPSFFLTAPRVVHDYPQSHASGGKVVRRPKRSSGNQYAEKSIRTPVKLLCRVACSPEQMYRAGQEDDGTDLGYSVNKLREVTVHKKVMEINKGSLVPYSRTVCVEASEVTTPTMLEKGNTTQEIRFDHLKTRIVPSHYSSPPFIEPYAASERG